MGRLEDIVERNRNPKAGRERFVVGIGFGVFILIILALMVFTNLGLRPEPEGPPAPSGPHVDDVLLRTPRARPTTPHPTPTPTTNQPGVRP